MYSSRYAEMMLSNAPVTTESGLTYRPVGFDYWCVAGQPMVWLERVKTHIYRADDVSVFVSWPEVNRISDNSIKPVVIVWQMLPEQSPGCKVVCTTTSELWMCQMFSKYLSRCQPSHHHLMLFAHVKSWADIFSVVFSRLANLAFRDGQFPSMLWDCMGPAITQEGWCGMGRSGELQTDIKHFNDLQTL